MAEAKISLQRQLSALAHVRGQWINGPARKAGRPAETQHIVQGLDQIRVTLEWLAAHEQTIRDAISSARTVDDTQDTR
jgi:hypothetical protein